MEALKRYEEEKRLVNLEIQKALIGRPESIYRAARHLCLAGGKMLRPLLCVMSCEAAGGKRSEAVKTGAAIEIMHTFTLVHDDIMDNDDLRRGRPSVHKVYGIPTAILAGDLLYSKAFEMCDPKTVHLLAETTSEICEGQELDMSFEDRADVSEKEYLEMIEKKTAVLMKAATRSGALVAKASDEAILSFSSYGLALGMAFQIQDDILGLTADEKKLGKPVGSDIIEGKKSLVVIRALQALSDADSKELSRILKKKDNTDLEVRKAIKMIRDCGAIAHCRKTAEGYVKEAKSSLDAISDSQARKDLLSIADYVVERDL